MRYINDFKNSFKNNARSPLSFVEVNDFSAGNRSKVPQSSGGVLFPHYGCFQDVLIRR